MRKRTVELHEGIKSPIPGEIGFLVVVGPAKRPGFKVSPRLQLGIITDLGSPLAKEK